jgi:hypothetical protein
MTQFNILAQGKTLTANKPTLRVRSVEGILEVRPTHRTNTSRLPAGEFLVEVKSRGFYSQAIIPSSYAEGDYTMVEIARTGWFKILPASGVVSLKVKA